MVDFGFQYNYQNVGLDYKIQMIQVVEANLYGFQLSMQGAK